VDENPVEQPRAPSPVVSVEEAFQIEHQNLEVIAAQVVKEFDPNHQLAELTSSWNDFMVGAASFDNKFKVNT
jgi:hypothetical protein